jgi:hypothetical protein
MRIGAVLVAGDEGVLVANRLPGGLPVIDQVDTDAAAACQLLAVEVRPPGHTLRLLNDPVALGARLGLRDREAADAAAVGRALADHANAVVGLLPAVAPSAARGLGEPWVKTADGDFLPLRTVCPRLADWPVGKVRAFGTGPVFGTFGAGAGESDVDDLFAVDLAAAAEAATARPGSTGRAVLVASLSRAGPEQAAPILSKLLDVPVHSPVIEPAAARLGALTTPGARKDAVVVDLGAGTVDVIGPNSSVVAAGAGELLTVAVAEVLGIPRAAADWVKRGPCVQDPAQVLVVGGPAGDEELLSVIARSLPDGVAVGRGDVGGTCAGEPLGHRYAVALGLALA